MMQNIFFSLLPAVFSALSSLYRGIFDCVRKNMVCKSESSLYGWYFIPRMLSFLIFLVIQKGFIRISLEQNKVKWTFVRKIEMFVIPEVHNIESVL